MTARRKNDAAKRPSRAAKASGPGARERLRIRLETIGDIAEVLGHESRNLFGALKTCLHVLRRNPNLGGEDRELLEIIENGSKRLGDVMADFAVFRHTSPPHVSEFALRDLLEEILTTLASDPRAAPSLAIERNLDPAIGAVRGNRDHLRQAFWHLCLNAADAAGEGGTVGVDARNSGTWIQVIVCDNGPGIAPGEIEKIFHPLYTTKPRSAGLGLAVAQRVVALHGGRISAVSEPRQGARLIVELPAAPDVASTSAPAARTR